MATQQSRFPRNRWLDPLQLISGKHVYAARRLRHSLQVLALLAACCFAAPGALSTAASAAPTRPLSCPTSPSPGVGECQGTVLTALIPASFAPPSGGPLIWGGTWNVCMAYDQLLSYSSSTGQRDSLEQFLRLLRANQNGFVWEGNWIITLQSTSGGLALIQFNGLSPWAPGVDLDNPSSWPKDWADAPKCPPPTPPCMTCLPQLGSLFTFDFFAYAPIADISGEAQCPPSSPAGSWCPPSVGNPITLTVTGFHSARGPTGVTEDLGAVDGFADVQLSISWNPAQQVGPLVWNFDDEAVDPTTGQAQRTPTVTSGVNQPVSHTFAYSSLFDPIRQCVRPCPGDLTGPPMAGYPNGTPAFQISVSSNWNLLYTERVTDFEGQTATTSFTVDLRQFGSPTPYFTSATTLPLFVVSYGSVTP